MYHLNTIFDTPKGQYLDQPQTEPNWRERLRGAVNTPNATVLVYNDDLFRALARVTELEKQLGATA